MASISIGKKEGERGIVHFISICVNIPFASKQTTLCSYCFLISHQQIFVKQIHNMRITASVCGCEFSLLSNRRLHASKLMIVSPLHPDYLSSLRVLWKIAKCLETMPTCVTFDLMDKRHICTLRRCIKLNFTVWILCAFRFRTVIASW